MNTRDTVIEALLIIEAIYIAALYAISDVRFIMFLAIGLFALLVALSPLRRVLIPQQDSKNDKLHTKQKEEN